VPLVPETPRTVPPPISKPPPMPSTSSKPQAPRVPPFSKALPSPSPRKPQQPVRPLPRVHARTNKHKTRKPLAQHITEHRANPTGFSEHRMHHICHPQTGAKQSYDRLKLSNPPRWTVGMANEFGRLASGVGTRMPTGTNTIFFIDKGEVPPGRTVTYANAVCDCRPTKDDPWRVRLTVGDDKLDCPGDPGAPAASLLDSKLVINSTISTPGATFFTTDIKDCFLNNPMDRYEHMKIPVRWIPQEIMDQHNLADKVDANGHACVEIRKGMHGLIQAARIAYDRLVQLLAPHGCCPIRHSPGIWKHNRPPSPCVSMIWKSSTPIHNMPTISLTHCKSTAKSRQIGRAQPTAACTYNGTATKAMWTCPCRPAQAKPYKNSSTPNRPKPNTLPMIGFDLRTAPKCSMPRNQPSYPPWTKSAQHACKPSTAPCSTTDVQQTQPCSRPLMKSPRSRLVQPP
jgi:hypothetical protein